MKTQLLRLHEAAAKYNIPEQEITDLIDAGELEAYQVDEMPLVAVEDVANVAANLVKREDFQHLDGVQITITDASFKYHFHTGTISKWIQQGHIRVLQRTANQVYVNEADVAYAKALADLKGTKRGSSLFKK
jgi:hypothetical protein